MGTAAHQESAKSRKAEAPAKWRREGPKQMHQCVQADLARDSFRAVGQNLLASCLAPRREQGLPFKAPVGVPIRERVS